MKVFKTTVEVFVIGDTQIEAWENLTEELDYLVGADTEDLKIVGYTTFSFQKLKFDKEATERLADDHRFKKWDSTEGRFV